MIYINKNERLVDLDQQVVPVLLLLNIMVSPYMYLVGYFHTSLKKILMTFRFNLKQKGENNYRLLVHPIIVKSLFHELPHPNDFCLGSNLFHEG